MQLLYGQLIVGSSALVINVLAARVLEPEGRGELAFAIQLSYVLSVFVLLGADKAYPIVSGPVSLRAALVDFGQILRLPACVVLLACVAAGIVMSTHFPGALQYSAGIVLLALASSSVVAIRSCAIAAREGGAYLRSVGIGQGILLLVCLIPVILHDRSPIWWLLAYAVCTSVPLGVVLLTWAKVGPATAVTDVARRIREARRLRWRIAPSAVTSLAMLRLDRLLIPWLSSSRELGLYIVVATLTEILYWPIQHYVDSHVPQWRKAYSSATFTIRKSLIRCGLYLIFAGIVCTAAVSFLIVPLFGDEYIESSSLVVPLVLAACCYGVSRVGVGLSLATGSVGSTVASDGSGAFVTLGLGLALIPQYGAMGAALASLIGYLTAAVVSLLLCLRHASATARSRGDPRNATVQTASEGFAE